MGKQTVRHAVHSQETTSVEVVFDPEFEKLANRSTKKTVFTKDMDARLIRYWPTKNHSDVAKLLGVSETTAIKRWRELLKTPAG